MIEGELSCSCPVVSLWFDGRCGPARESEKVLFRNGLPTNDFLQSAEGLPVEQRAQ